MLRVWKAPRLRPDEYQSTYLLARARSEPGRVSEAELRLSFLQDLMSGELGLKLEPRKASVEFLVIDRVDHQPTEN